MSFVIGKYNPAEVFGGLDSIVTSKLCNESPSTLRRSFFNGTGAALIIDSVTIPSNTVFRLTQPLSFPVIVAPSDSLRFEIAVENAIGRATDAQLTVFLRNCGVVGRVALRANLVNAVLTVSIPDTTARIGDDWFMLPLIITASCISGRPERYECDVSFDGYVFTALYAFNATLVGITNSGRTQTARLIIEPDFAAQDSVYVWQALLNGMMLLDEKTTTSVEAAVVAKPHYLSEVRIRNGSITADSICARNLRLIQGVPNVLFGIAYNATSDALEVQIGGGFSTGYALSVYDANGRNIADYTLPYSPEQALKQLPAALQSGMYLAVLRNGLYLRTLPLTIVR